MTKLLEFEETAAKATWRRKKTDSLCCFFCLPCDIFLQVHGLEGQEISPRALSQPEDVVHREVQAQRDQFSANNPLDALLAP